MGVSLAVSSIPEGLPIVVTVALALGVKRMVKMNVLTKKLPAIESLGGVDVICTDKTGTITKNKMEVVDSFVLGSSISELALLSVLSSDAKVDHGDPTEVALVNFLKKYPKQDQLTQDYVRTAEIPFSSENKYMAVAVQNLKGQTQAIIKGAPEVVLQFCKIKADDREKALQAFAVFAKQGLRVLAVISKELSDKKELSVLQGYTFNGLLAMHDPPREQVAASILKCYKAGVKVIMITGDHKDTAVSVAKAVGLQSDLVLTGQELDLLDKKELREVVQKCQIFARVSPQNKVQILQALQSLGLQVAMTGDGVNDAPALKKADIGIAVGSGTALSRDVADMVLLSDDFSNIVDGMQEGRHIFFNIKKFVKFLLSANFDEILCVATSILFSLPLSFLPIHVLWLNLVTDSFPALALSNDVAEKSLMDKKPYLAKEEIMKGVISYSIIAGFWGYLVTFSTFLFMLHVAGSSLDYARTMSFSAMVFFELFLVFSVRSEQSAFKIGFFSNKFLLGSVAFAFVLQLLAIYHPFFQSFLKTVSLSTSDLGWLLLWSSSGFTFMELLKKGKALYAQR
jgi:Ca2+-transporting ATPase